MPVRRTLSSLVGRVVQSQVREWIDEASEGHAQQVAALRRELDDSAAKTAKLEQKLSMAMGAIQASTTQLVQVRETATQSANASQQALQKSTMALNTAEAVADGVTGVEGQMAALMERIAAGGSGSPAEAAQHAGTCQVDGCRNKHRARGYCAKHYQQWKRGTLA